MAKLKQKDYEEIRQMYMQGETKGNIARKKSISKYYVESIISGGKGEPPSGLYVQRKTSEPRGGLTKEMIREAKRRLRVGSTVIVQVDTEENGYLKHEERKCKVTGKYPNVFTYIDGMTTGSFKYRELLIATGNVKAQ